MEVRGTLAQAVDDTRCAPLARSLGDALKVLDEVTLELQDQVRLDATLGLSNATIYLDLFGRVLVGWLWLRMAMLASRALTQGTSSSEADFYRGKLQAARYFMDWELATLEGQARLLIAGNRTSFDMQDPWF
ncbi:hypothetical protein D3C81_1516360 [compost metagenome]